jgi:hypothetical protein
MDSIQQAARGPEGRRESSALPRLMTWWIAGCAVVIVLGLNRMHPEVGQRLAYAFRDPAMDLERPFPTCKAAHAAGYYDIPRESPAYVRWQDPENRGLACEPPEGVSSGRLAIIRQRLMAPTGERAGPKAGPQAQKGDGGRR